MKRLIIAVLAVMVLVSSSGASTNNTSKTISKNLVAITQAYGNFVLLCTTDNMQYINRNNIVKIVTTHDKIRIDLIDGSHIDVDTIKSIEDRMKVLKILMKP